MNNQTTKVKKRHRAKLALLSLLFRIGYARLWTVI